MAAQRACTQLRGKFFGLFAGVGCILACAQPGLSEEVKDYGKPGSPIELVVGYQPYYTQSWSGVIMRSKKFYEKYLPKGSTVDFQIGLQGAIIVNNLLAGKQHIGYMGDMPAIVSTTKPEVADVRLVAVVGMGWDQCNVFLVRNDAPKFASDQEAIKWLDGKTVAVPKGSCTDRFAQAVFKKAGVQPSAYLNQNIEVITSNFRAGKIDAAVIWEPTVSRLVQEGLARKVATGASVSENDAGFLGMRADLIKQRPDVVKAWLNAELDAQQYFADPKNAMEISKIAQEQTTGFSQKVLWMAAYGTYPKEGGGTPTRIILPYTFTPEAMELIKRASAFLFEIKSINSPTLRPDAVMPEFAQAVLKERGVTAPLGEIKQLPESAYTGAK
jgi:NitT/TauT family transport system substrate-binding protein